MATLSALGNLRHIARPASRRRGLMGALLAFEAWLDRHAQRRALSDLDDHMLQDIGLSRADVEAETKKWFWQN